MGLVKSNSLSDVWCQMNCHGSQYNNKTKCNVQQTFGFFVRKIFVRTRASDFRKVKNISRTIEPKLFGKFKDNNFS